MYHSNCIRSEIKANVAYNLLQDLAETNTIELQLSSVQAHNTIGVGGQYYAPSKRIYSTVPRKHPMQAPNMVFSLSIKEMNDAIRKEGLVPLLMVSRVTPSLSFINKTLPNQRERMAALAELGQKWKLYLWSYVV